MTMYETLQKNLATGWNTWNSESVLSHVLLPEGLGINLGIKEYKHGHHLYNALIGRKDREPLVHEAERVIPGVRSYDGTYTELTVTWLGVTLDVRTAALEGDELVMLIRPTHTHKKQPLLTIAAAYIWGYEGCTQRKGEVLTATKGTTTRTVYVSGTPAQEPYTHLRSPYVCRTLDSAIVVCVGRERSEEEVVALLDERRANEMKRFTRFGDLAETYKALAICMAWDTVYDPLNARVISPVSRIWSSHWQGGYVLFCWDTYFAAYLAHFENRALAYANAVEITREITERGFVPNLANATGKKSHDRSQPPVGSMMVLEIYKKYREAWFLEEVFDALLTWNRRWENARIIKGYLAWGSNDYDPPIAEKSELWGIGERFGGALESGLDNSPMYDDVPFNTETETLELADAGLIGLCVADCYALAEIADILGKQEIADEVRARGEKYRASCADLWDEDRGLYYNLRTDTREFSRRISPTNFYPLLGKIATDEQARRMIDEHYFNEEEFHGKYVMPSIAKNDPAFPDQDYWRGKIWAPMNFLVYLGMRNYACLDDARKDLAERSNALFLQEWYEEGHVHENYSPLTGKGYDEGTPDSSDGYYHWGALLGAIALMESCHELHGCVENEC